MQADFAGRYGTLEQWHWWFVGRQRILETVLLRELPDRSTRTIVSIGCGPREGLGWLTPFAGPGGHTIGIDADAVHASGGNGTSAYCIGRLEGVPLRSGAADVVLTLDVLEHVADDVAGLREAARIVKPGGLLLVTVPALPSLWGGQDVVSHHLRRYTPRAFRQMFEHARIPNPRITYFNTLLFPSVAAVRWARRAAGLASRPRSDFDDTRPGMVNDVLAAIFGAERHLIARLRLPIGVSLLAIVHLPR